MKSSIPHKPSWLSILQMSPSQIAKAIITKSQEQKIHGNHPANTLLHHRIHHRIRSVWVTILYMYICLFFIPPVYVCLIVTTCPIFWPNPPKNTLTWSVEIEPTSTPKTIPTDVWTHQPIRWRQLAPVHRLGQTVPARDQVRAQQDHRVLLVRDRGWWDWCVGLLL